MFLDTRNLTDLEIAQIWLVSNFEIERIEANERQTQPSTHFSTSLRLPSQVVIIGISPLPFLYHTFLQRINLRRRSRSHSPKLFAGPSDSTLAVKIRRSQSLFTHSRSSKPCLSVSFCHPIGKIASV